MVVASSTAENLERALGLIGRSFAIAMRSGRLELVEEPVPASNGDGEVAVRVPACRLEDLGDASFRTDHGLRYALMSGAMANGIGSVEIVEAMGRRGLLGIFGAAGLPLNEVERAIDRIQHLLGDSVPYGVNLIHSPGEPELEAAVVDLFLRRRVRLVEASAFLNLTLPVVRYRVAGLARDESGRSSRQTASSPRSRGSKLLPSSWLPRPPRCFESWSPPARSRPSKRSGRREFPMADDITAEADSGGHTDNQPAIVMLPTMLNLRDTMSERYNYDRPLRVGAAGGISTPWAAAAALAMGAAYLVTGSVNQSCVEAATSDACPADARTGTTIGYRDGTRGGHVRDGGQGASSQARHAVRDAGRQALRVLSGVRRPRPDSRWPSGRTSRRRSFRAPLETIWEQTKEYFQQRDPSRIDRANSRSQAKDGARVSLVSGDVVALGQQRRAVANRRLPDLVRAGHGGLQ